MDARLRVIIEPSEDILSEYEEPKEEPNPIAPPSQATEFNRWLTRGNPYSPPPHPLKLKIVEDIESAATSGDPIKQRPAPSLLDERAESQLKRQNTKDYAEMTGATCN
jgi:hypothetical protein